MQACFEEIPIGALNAPPPGTAAGAPPCNAAQCEAMEKYYLHLDNEQKGPFTIGQLQAMWQAGTIHRDTQFFTKSNAEWKTLEAILDLLEPAPAPPEQAPASEPSAAAAASSTVTPQPAAPPRAPAGLGRCPECGGLGGHLAGCPAGAASTAPGVSPLAAATAAKVATMPPPTSQQWRERMAEAAHEPHSTSMSNRPVLQSFHVLEFFSIVMKGLGWLVVVIGAIWAVVSLSNTRGDVGFHTLVNLMPAIGVTALGILFIVIGELIGVFFSIEKNTFKAAASLDTIARNLRQNK